MDSAERNERVIQEVRKRYDFVRFQFPLGRSPKVRAAEPGNFFFRSSELPCIVALVKSRFPAEVEFTIRRAEKICAHRFTLLGYEDLDYGVEIDWHLDRVNGKRAPWKPWFQIRYLDFEEVGDSKVTWELNRHQHLVTLAKAFLFSGRDEFVHEIVSQLRNWEVQNPYPIGINWASSLEVAFRSISWLWVSRLLEDCSLNYGKVYPQLIRLLELSGRHIERYLSTYFSPNTHLLGEAVALFLIGILCPELAPADRWRRNGWNLILDCARRQVGSDGFYFEQSTYYHLYAVDFFLHARIIASRNGMPIPSWFDSTIKKMLDVTAVFGISGHPPRFGDEDGGRLFDPSRNRAEHLLDPLSTGAALYPESTFRSQCCRLSEETVWLLGSDGVASFDQLEQKTAPCISAKLEDCGIHVLANADRSAQLFVDAGYQGALGAGHGHADALSICLSEAGREWLTDPGTFVYTLDSSDRMFFRGTAAHNTLQVDALDQSEAATTFGWKCLPEVATERWLCTPTFDLFIGRHDGYQRLSEPVLHRRWIFNCKAHSFWLVRDLATGTGSHQLDLRWHFGPACRISMRSHKAYITREGDKSRLNVFYCAGQGCSQRTLTDWWSPVYGQRIAAPTLEISTQGDLPAEFTTLFALDDVGDVLTEVHAGHGISCSCWRSPYAIHVFVFADQKSQWIVGPIQSDARFVHCILHNETVHFLAVDATYVQVADNLVLQSREPFQYQETVKDLTPAEAKLFSFFR